MLKLKITDENGETIYEGFAEHLSSLISAIAGYDEVNKTWMPIGVTDRGLSKTANYIWNTESLAWETATGSSISGQTINPQNLTVRMDMIGYLTYIGKAVIGSLDSDAAWQIQRIDESSGLVIKWADGNCYFDNIWNNRLTLNYL